MNLNSDDFTNLSVGDLRELIKKAAGEIDKRRKKDKRKTLNEIKKLAESRGFELNELFGSEASGKRRGGGERPIKYQHPEDPAKTWTGQGRKPKWMAEWEASGRSVDELMVK
jgi:DNA-binding protein H-NS